MSKWEKRFPGQRNTRLIHQTPGEHKAIYPWVITQSNNGAVVKLSDEQMQEIINVVLDHWDLSTKKENGETKESIS